LSQRIKSRSLAIVYLFSMLIIPLSAQESPEWENDYQHYYGTYKSDFLCKWVLSVKQCDSLNAINTGNKIYCGFFNLTLTKQGTYSMTLACYNDLRGKTEEIYNEYKGLYVVNEAGNVILKGSHPFDKNILQIFEGTRRNKGKKYVSYRRFTYRFDDLNNWISEKRLNAFCDGCYYDPGD
jgi:hypothetical protein